MIEDGVNEALAIKTAEYLVPERKVQILVKDKAAGIFRPQA
jgi:hypothetical protein